MEKITFEEGIIRLQQNFKLEDVFIEEDFQWRGILNQNEEILSDLSFSNCFFGGKFGLYVATCRGSLRIHNCTILNDFSLFNVFMYGDFLMSSSRIKGTSNFSDGAFYQDIYLAGNIFEGFADFEDANVRGNATFIQNQFRDGTNFIHPEGGPWGAQCASPPHLEGNTGLDKYEGSAKQNL